MPAEPPGNPKSVLFLCTALQRAGAETQVASLATAFRQRGWDVSVVSMTPPGSANPLALLRFRRILRHRLPTILHSHLVHANLLARLTRLITHVPLLISTAHSVSEGNVLRRWAYRLTDPMSDLTTNVSRAAVDRYVQVGAAPADRIRFVPNGLITQRFICGTEVRHRLRADLQLDDAFAWLAIGRFEEAKDYPNLLRAFARVLQRSPDALLLMAGRGKLQDETKQFAEELRIADRIQFLGVRSDVPQLMAAADAYVLSSAWEGMPMVLLEASGAALPIVATRVGGNAEVVLDGESGFLTPAKDSPALAEAMVQMMRLSEGERKAMGERGRSFVKANFDMSIVVEQWERVYAEFLAAKGVPLCA
jgi:glycosyltransferase involved in cell wall biosynthesis